ncbi:MAG: hypothetical protein QXK37_01490 [Candidatus Woesearchaeota archaeon]
MKKGGIRKNGQQSLEYLLTITLVFLALIGALVGYYYFHKRTVSDVETIEVKKIGNEIIDVAEMAYSTGGYTLRKLNFKTPDSVESIYVPKGAGNELVFNISTPVGITSVSFKSDVLLVDMINKSNIGGGLIYIVKDYGVIILSTGLDYTCVEESCHSDENTLQGVCKEGNLRCSLGDKSVCVNEILPRPEDCNALDDDCDGETDEIYTDNDSCIYLCLASGYNWTGYFGQNACCGDDSPINGGNEPSVSADYEISETIDNDGIDNDCDGLLDYRGDIVCRMINYSSECNDITKEIPILRLENSTRGHDKAVVQTTNYSDYKWTLCCRSRTLDVLEVFNISDSERCMDISGSSAGIIELSSWNNSKIARYDDTTPFYSIRLCLDTNIGDTTCSVKSGSAGGCSGNEGCLFSFGNDVGEQTDAYIGDCNSEYDKKVCCSIN